MKKYFCVAILFFAVACKFPLNSNYSENFSKDKTFHLNLNPKGGSVYHYYIENNSEFNIKVDEKEIDNINNSEVGINYAVASDSSGNYLLKMSYDKIHIYSKNGDKEIDADAQNANFSSNPTERMLGVLKNASLTAVISPKGDVKGIGGYKELSSQLMADLDTTDVNVKQIAQGQLDKIIGSQLVQKNLEQLFKIFPDSAIHVGDKWKINATQNGDFNLNVKSVFHLDDIDNDMAYVRSESEIEGDHTPLAMMGYSVVPNLRGSQTATYAVEAKTGMLINSLIESEVKGSLQLAGKEVPITINVKVRVTGARISKS